jgi:hypothetical protein
MARKSSRIARRTDHAEKLLLGAGIGTLAGAAAGRRKGIVAYWTQPSPNKCALKPHSAENDKDRDSLQVSEMKPDPNHTEDTDHHYRAEDYE